MGQDFPDFFLTGSQVEFVVRRGHGIGGQVPVHVFTDLVVGTPVPGRGQDGIPGFRIVPDCMVDGTGAAGRGDGCGESFRTGLAEAGVLDQFQVFRQSMMGAYLKYSASFSPRNTLLTVGSTTKFSSLSRMHPMVALITASAPISLIRFWAASLAPKIRSLDGFVFFCACGATQLFIIMIGPPLSKKRTF